MVVGGESAIFIQLGLIIIAAAILAFLFRLLKQPQLLAYIIVGVLITPVFSLITDTSIIAAMSIIGIAFLLFLVGVEIDISSLRNVALVSTFGGIIQISLLFVTGFLVALLLNFLPLEAMYIGLMLAFSSTMITMKTLSDRKELNTLHGRIVVGILLMEDLFAIFALSILSSVNSFDMSFLGIAFLKFVALFVIAYICSKFVFPIIFKFAARNQELLLITSLAVCFIFSLGFHYFGFSIVIGAFVAGLTLGNLDYNLEIIGKVKSLRDFFSLLFFVSLGMGLSLTVISKYLVPIIVFFFFITLFKPFLVMTISSVFKYTKKPAFMSALYLTQIGEFSLIIASQGFLLGHLGQDIFTLVVVVTLATITTTSYLVKFKEQLYKVFDKPLQVYDVFHTEGLEFSPTKAEPKVVLCGHNRIGYSILRGLQTLKDNVLIVDYNPEVISKLVKKGYHCIYGEVEDQEIMDRMNLKNLDLLISTIPYINVNRILIRKAKEENRRIRIIVTANTIDDALKMYTAGAHYVILPHFLGGERVADMISGVRRNRVDLLKERANHMAELKGRKDIGHEHPFSLF